MLDPRPTGLLIAAQSDTARTGSLTPQTPSAGRGSSARSEVVAEAPIAQVIPLGAAAHRTGSELRRHVNMPLAVGSEIPVQPAGDDRISSETWSSEDADRCHNQDDRRRVALALRQ